MFFIIIFFSLCQAIFVHKMNTAKTQHSSLIQYFSFMCYTLGLVFSAMLFFNTLKH